ncbi:MAG: HTTM domain-containing protein [Acidobacteriota bacterium]
MPLAAFFRAETPARPLALARICMGLAAFIRAAIQYQILRSLLSGEFIRANRFDWLPALTSGTFLPFMAVWMIACLSFAAGFRTRLSGSIVTACLAYQIALDENLYANNFYLMTLILFLLTVADSGCSFSVDRWLFRKGPEMVARWSTLLPRLQISIVYFYSALVKINSAFLAGEPIARSTRLGPYLDKTAMPMVVAYATVGLEFFLSIALWMPPLRRAAVTLAFLLHFNIFVGMENRYTVAMFTFGVTTLAPLLLFLEYAPASRVVLWNEESAAARRWVAFFRFFDWLGIYRFESASVAGLALTLDDRTLTGFAAAREVLCTLPISFYWAPLLAVVPTSSSASHRAA